MNDCISILRDNMTNYMPGDINEILFNHDNHLINFKKIQIYNANWTSMT